MPNPALKKMILTRDIPLFSGVIKAGTEVSLICEYIDGTESVLCSVQVGFLRIDCLCKSALSEKASNFPF